MIRRWRTQRAGFHHDWRTGQSWITGRLIDMGMPKLFACSRCEKRWIT